MATPLRRPNSMELEHVTVGEVTPTVYIKQTNNVIDESIQKSEVLYKYKHAS